MRPPLRFFICLGLPLLCLSVLGIFFWTLAGSPKTAPVSAHAVLKVQISSATLAMPVLASPESQPVTLRSPKAATRPFLQRFSGHVNPAAEMIAGKKTATGPATEERFLADLERRVKTPLDPHVKEILRMLREGATEEDLLRSAHQNIQDPLQAVMTNAWIRQHFHPPSSSASRNTLRPPSIHRRPRSASEDRIL